MKKMYRFNVKKYTNKGENNHGFEAHRKISSYGNWEYR